MVENELPRKPLRSLIPPHINVPKFCTSKDIEAILKAKEENPKKFWVDIIREVLLEKRNTDE